MNSLQQELKISKRVIMYVMVIAGILLVVVSAFFSSTILAIIGFSILFWGSIIFYISPSKHVSLALLSASAEPSSGNIERILTGFNLTQNGIYLPPKNLGEIQSHLIFVPETSETLLPNSEEITGMLLLKEKNGVLLVPPGSSLSDFLEKEVGLQFGKIDLTRLNSVLPKLLVEDLELAEGVEVTLERDLVTIQITNSVFDTVCRQTDSYPRTHKQIGCLFSSALACVIAKTSGKPIVIQGETRTPEKTIMQFRTMEK